MKPEVCVSVSHKYQLHKPSKKHHCEWRSWLQNVAKYRLVWWKKIGTQTDAVSDDDLYERSNRRIHRPSKRSSLSLVKNTAPLGPPYALRSSSPQLISPNSLYRILWTSALKTSAIPAAQISVSFLIHDKSATDIESISPYSALLVVFTDVQQKRGRLWRFWKKLTKHISANLRRNSITYRPWVVTLSWLM